MKHSRTVLAILTAVALVATIPATVEAAESHDHHHEAAAAELHLNQGRKWPTDAVLRRGMAAMRTDLAGRLPAIHKGDLDPDQYAAIARSIEGEVGTIVGQCKLEPEADAMLHIVIADLMGAAATMQGKAPGRAAEGAHRAVAALNNYGKYFSHPGWLPIR